MKDKYLIVAILGVMLGAAAVFSGFCYAAFDYQWWRPIPEREIGRGFLLFLAHVVSSFIGAASTMYLMDRE